MPLQIYHEQELKFQVISNNSNNNVSDSLDSWTSGTTSCLGLPFKRLSGTCCVKRWGTRESYKKVQAVLNWPLPRDSKKVHGFLRLTGYYRRFVKGYGLIAKPLTDLTKKNGFMWNEEAQSAFEKLKLALTTVPVLQLLNFHEPFMVECDASSTGVGAILLQSEYPIAFFSTGLLFSSRLKSTYDQELLALVLALQKWRHYLLGRQFFVKTDHFNLKHLFAQRVTTNEQQRLLMKLLPFDFTIIYKAGKENQGADALSRRPQHGKIPQHARVWSSPYRLVDFIEVSLSRFCIAIHGDEAGIDIRGCHTNGVWASIVGSIFHLHSSGIVPLNSIRFKIISPGKNKDCFIQQRIANGSWFWDWSRPINVGRTKAEFDALISDVASLEPGELVDFDTCIWSLSHDDKFSVNSVRKHIDELSLPSLCPSSMFPSFSSCGEWDLWFQSWHASKEKKDFA
ncbi:hypothetical protein Tco_1028447 [Tanacetum coccineum]|uniref:Reverse transcriptase/retrotransposon-derived protein RNase H-like domain-containing protein n=1 Tax=Tanacetum coccineum TaxID=301880 RepID=A0ABQ5G0V2_9ASTR